MNRCEIGMLAKSISGHDRGKNYVILDADETYVYLVDGVNKTMEKPKKKKKKHVQIIRKQHEVSQIDDVRIKRILKLYKESQGSKKEDL